MGPQIKEEEEGIRVTALFWGKGLVPVLFHLCSLGPDQSSHKSLHVHHFRCWPCEFCSSGDHLPGEQQASRRAKTILTGAWVTRKEVIPFLTYC